MDRDSIIATLRAHELELKAGGIVSLSLFGSVARGDARADSDIDLVVRLSDEASQGGFGYFGRLDALGRRLGEILEHPVDIVTEPVRQRHLRQAIEKDRAFAF